MHYSGLLVVTRPRHVDEVIRDLSSIPGVEVHHRDPESGRLVVVQEGPSLEGQKRTLLRIQSLPRVIHAELVYHYRDEGPEEASCVSLQHGAREVEP